MEKGDDPEIVSVLPAPNCTDPVPASAGACVRVTAAPETTLLPASFKVTVSVVEPVVEIEDEPEVIVTVEPVMLMGIWAVADPAVAVIVAVRLIGLLPEEKVTVALPSLPVTAVGIPRTPVSVPIVIVTLDSAEFKEFNALMVIVEDVESSDFTVAGEAKMSRENAVAETAVPVLVMIMALVEPVMLA